MRPSKKGKMDELNIEFSKRGKFTFTQLEEWDYVIIAGERDLIEKGEREGSLKWLSKWESGSTKSAPFCDRKD